MDTPERDLNDLVAEALCPDGAVIAGWVLVAAIQSVDDEHGGALYRVACPDSQLHHSTLGLLYQGVDTLCSAADHDDEDES